MKIRGKMKLEERKRKQSGDGKKRKKKNRAQKIKHVAKNCKGATDQGGQVCDKSRQGCGSILDRLHAAMQ